MHRCVTPFDKTNFGNFSALTIDHGVEINDVTIPFADIALSVSRHESLKRMEVLPPSNDGDEYDKETLVAYDWAHLRNPSRLSVVPEPIPISTNQKMLAKAIGFLPFHTFTYVDPSFLTMPLEDQFRKTLEKTGYNTTREIYNALSEKGNLPNNCLAHKFRQGKPPPWIRTQGTNNLEEPWQTAFEQYIALLIFRKQFGIIIQRELNEKLGRQPSEQEWMGRLRELSGNHEERALDARKSVSDPHYYLEDALVAFALLKSIIQGHDCVLLTKRKVVQQQFISFVLMLDKHYRAWSLAVHDPIPSDRNSGKVNKQLNKFGFQGPVSLRGVSPGYANRCLPSNAIDVQLSCWLIEERKNDVLFKPISYLAERPMHAMLKVRSKTNGLTTDLLGDEDLMFSWAGDKENYYGQICRGKSDWTRLGTRCLPRDKRMMLNIEKISTKDLVMMANYSDLPSSRITSVWPTVNSPLVD